MDHLGAQPHDQQHRFCVGIAKNLVAELNAVGPGDPRRLMGCNFHLGCSSGMSRNGIAMRTLWHGFSCRRSLPDRAEAANRRLQC
jgi:hypothetical protein